MYAKRAMYGGIIALLAMGVFGLARFELPGPRLLSPFEVAVTTTAGGATTTDASADRPVDGLQRPVQRTLVATLTGQASPAAAPRDEHDPGPAKAVLPAHGPLAAAPSQGIHVAAAGDVSPRTRPPQATENTTWRREAIAGGDDAAAAPAGSVSSALDEDAVRLLQALGQALYGDADPETRIEALHRLAADGSPAASALVLAAMADPNESVRRVAEALAQTLPAPIAADATDAEGGYPLLDDAAAAAGIDPVAARLRDPLATERLAAIDELYFHEVATAARLLREVLERDDDAQVREQALATLDFIGGHEAVEAMSSALGDDDVHIRQQAVQALWNAGSQTVPLLGQALFGDPDPEVRTRVVHLLAADASPAALALLEAATADPDEGVRGAARLLLGR